MAVLTILLDTGRNPIGRPLALLFEIDLAARS